MEQIIYIQMDLALNNPQRLICHKTKPNLMDCSEQRQKNEHYLNSYYLSPRSDLGLADKRETYVYTVSECCWAGIHFGWPCWLVYWSGRVCLGSSYSWLRLSDMDSRNLAFMSGVPRPASSSLQELFPQALTLLGGARFIGASGILF